MEEQKQTTSTEQSSSDKTQSEVQSLDQVYKQFNVEAEAERFQSQAQVQTQNQLQKQSQEVTVPDPVLDAEGFKKYQSAQSQSIQQAVSSIKGELSALQGERLRRQEEADIKSAVERFRSITGEDIDADMAEVALGQKARKDPRFLAVYQNRSKNPQAWSAAVAAYANEFKSKTQFKTDPTIAENLRAAKASTQGSQMKSQTDEPQGDESRFKGKTGREFDREWRNYIDR